MQVPNNRRYDKCFAIISELDSLGCKTSKEKLLAEFSGGMRKGLRELSNSEFDSFEKFLQDKLSDARLINDKTCDRQRKKIIALFSKMGHTKIVTRNGVTKVIPDMPYIYSWVNKYGYLKKGLNQYNQSEIPKLVSQVESFHKKEVNGK